MEMQFTIHIMSPTIIKSNGLKLTWLTSIKSTESKFMLLKVKLLLFEIKQQAISKTCDLSKYILI